MRILKNLTVATIVTLIVARYMYKNASVMDSIDAPKDYVEKDDN